jgi:hypothetical protein
VLLNCTITNAKEKTIPIRANIPDAMEEKSAVATGTVLEDERIADVRSDRLIHALR